ncbi:MAG: hypothetical protein J6S14_13895 [Clostridia bacterium]|nr:hypothetical protein [Clostridia bacterium]
MKKIITRSLCALLMLAMLVPMMSVMASAADLTNLYDASKAVCGTPNSAQRDTAPTYNANYYCSEPIYVKEGDVITVGPVHVDQGYYFTTYKADGSVHTKQVKYADCVELEVIKANSVIVKWTVPAGVDSFRMATSQMFVDNTLITKNQEFGKADYIAFMEKAGADVSYFTGVNATGLVNLFPTSDSTFAGRGSTSGDIADAKYKTCDYIPVKEGDVIYFGAAASAQSYQIVLYDADKKPTTHGNYKYMVNVDSIDDTHVIYSYRIRPGSAYVRFVAPTDVYEAGKQLVTVNQPFTAEGYNNFFNPPAVTEPEVTEPVTPPTTGDSSLVFAAIAIISLIGVATVAKRREN